MPPRLKSAPLPPQSLRQQLGVPEGVSDATLQDLMQPWQPQPEMSEMFSPLQAGREAVPTALEVGAGVAGGALAAGTGIPGLIGGASLYTLAHNTAERMRALNRGEANPPQPTFGSVMKDFAVGGAQSMLPVAKGPLGYVQQGLTQAGIGQAQNLMEGQPLDLQQAGQQALMGTAFHGGFQGAGKAIAPLARKAAPLFEGQRVPMTAESGAVPFGPQEKLPKGVTKAADWPGVGRGYHVDVGQEGPTTIYVPEGENLQKHLQKTYKDFGMDPSAALKRIGERGSATIGGQKPPTQTTMGFYSRLQNFTDNLPDNASHNPLSLANRLQGGVTSKLELDETGVVDWLKQQKGKVSTQQVRDYIDQNQIKVEEKMLGGPSPERGDEDRMYRMAKHYDTLTPEEKVEYQALKDRVVNYQPGKFNRPETLTPFEHGADPDSYRELVMTLPAASETTKLQMYQLEHSFYVKYGVRDSWPEEAKQQLEQASQRYLNAPMGGFKSSHYPDIPNPLVHMRFDSRTAPDGKKVLFVHEIQSDWHQKGRKEGYRNPKQQESFNKHVAGGMPEFDAMRQAQEEVKGGSVPSAPFKSTTDWTGLAAKRLLRYASENGYDRIAWTPGEAQASRYDLSKHVDAIHWSKPFPGDEYVLEFDKGGETIRGLSQRVPSHKIADYVGKDIAEQIISKSKDEMVGTIKGEGLKVGGEGMVGFYGSPEKNQLGIMGGVMDSLGKKWGARVGTSEIATHKEPTIQGENYTIKAVKPVTHKVHSLDLPSNLKEEVKTKGQPIAGLLPTLLGQKERTA